MREQPVDHLDRPLGIVDCDVDVVDEIEALAVEQHVLLLDAERVRLALAERVVEDAAPRREALAGDRRRVDLLHRSKYPSFAAVFSLTGPADLYRRAWRRCGR